MIPPYTLRLVHAAPENSPRVPAPLGTCGGELSPAAMSLVEILAKQLAREHHAETFRG